MDNLIKNNCKKISSNLTVGETVDISNYGLIFIMESFVSNGKSFGSFTTIHRLVGSGTQFIGENGFKTSLGGIFKLEKNSLLTRISAAPNANNCDIYVL